MIFENDLINKFVHDNFDLSYFRVITDTNYIVHLVDKNGDVLTIVSLIPGRIFTLINDEKFLTYELSTSHGASVWLVRND